MGQRKSSLHMSKLVINLIISDAGQKWQQQHVQYHLKIKQTELRLRLRGSASCALVPLAEGGATVGAASLPQREAEEEAQGEEEDGTQDSQAGEVVLQDANSADKQRYWHHAIKASF